MLTFAPWEVLQVNKNNNVGIRWSRHQITSQWTFRRECWQVIVLLHTCNLYLCWWITLVGGCHLPLPCWLWVCSSELRSIILSERYHWFLLKHGLVIINIVFEFFFFINKCINLLISTWSPVVFIDKLLAHFNHINDVLDNKLWWIRFKIDTNA